MTTSSTSCLLPTNSPTTNLPPATTTNLPPATSTTINLPSATSTTSHLLLATSTTSHLPPTTSSTSHLLPSTSTARACNINEADLFVVPVVGEENLLIEAEIEANVILEPVKINTPRPSLYLHNETLGGTTYWEPNVDEPYLPLEGKRFDTIEECVEFYSVYAEKGGFEVKVPNPPSQKTGDVIEDIYAIKRVNNPQKASNKGGRRGERRKSGREIAMKAKAKRARKCGYCGEKTNKHTKTTFPLNPKYIAKLARTEAAAEQERRTAASATEQEERNSDTTHIADKEQSNTAS
ncbi:hypothetical protein Tco_0132876 [Tanacetum coccineum]